VRLAQVLPSPTEVEVEALPDLLTGLRKARRRPFDASVQTFTAALSRALLGHPRFRELPELAALGYWLRPSAVRRLAGGRDTAGGIDVPRGVVFHVPPANVDTMFVYSWMLSALCGNANVVRVPTRRTPSTEILLDLLGTLLTRHPDISASTSLLSYGHDAEITSVLSSSCDVRVLWGGDETVRRLRLAPLPPRATELTFPDRFSMSVLGAASLAEFSDADMATLGDAFANDVFWFDQGGCSSPRLVIWVGSEPQVKKASTRLYGAVADAVARRGWSVALGLVLAKQAFAFDSILEDDLEQVRFHSNEITVLRLKTLSALRRQHPGGGAFFEHVVESVSDLVGDLEGRDQTLTYSGIDVDELAQLVVALNGEGIDRVVPVGQALSFSRYWDGHDLLRSFSRRVDVPELGPTA